MSVFKSYFLASLGLITLFLTAPAYALPEKDTGNLGEIRQSILSVEAFQRIYGEGWVSMDGRNIEDSDLFREGLWGNVTIPDARGVYLRGKNYERAAEQGDPAGDRNLGAYIRDRFKSHNHGHDLRMPTNCGIGGAHATAQGSGGGFRYTPIDGEIKQSGELETCPRSIVVNTFIKINRTPESKQLNVILNAIEAIPGRIFGSEVFRQIQQRMGRAAGQVGPALPGGQVGAALPPSEPVRAIGEH